MSIVNRPKRARAFDLEGSDPAVGPPRDDNFISEYRAQRENTGLSNDRASCYNGIIIRVPEADGAILRASRELIRDPWHEVGIHNSLGMVFTE